MADTSFLEKLRMNNIFPSTSTTNEMNPTHLINMPDMYSGRPQNEPGLQQIARQSVTPPPAPVGTDQYGHPIGTNYAYNAPESDKYATKILMGDTAKDKDRELKSSIAASKNLNDTGKLSILQAKQTLAEKVASGKATDYEKFQHAMDLEDEKQSGRMDLQGSKSDTQYGIQGMKSSDAYGLQDIKGEQGLARISASIAGKKDLQNSKSKDLAPSQINNQQKNGIRQITMTRPDLAKYITQDTGGRMTIAPDTPLAALAEINKTVFGNPNGPDTSRDINLPSNSPDTITDIKPKVKPTAADLLKKYGG